MWIPHFYFNLILNADAMKSETKKEVEKNL